jgi:TonB family protein
VEKPSKPKPTAASAQKIEPTISDTSINPTFETPIDGNFDSAFGETSSFTDTMTDIAASVGKSISGARDSVTDGAMGMLDSVGEMSNSFKNTRMMAIGGGAVAAVAIVAWLIFSGDSSPDGVTPEQTVETTPAPVRSDPVVQTPVQQPTQQPTEAVAPPPPPSYAALLDEARAARDAGNLIAPAGNNAIELYVETLVEAGNDAGVVAEFNDVVSQVLGLAESAILARNAVEAEAALEMARLADPRNPRLTFLGAQLTELQLRDKTDQARVAIREERFEDAGVLISEARSLGATADVDLLTQELQSARNQQQVGEVITLANNRLDAGSLISPANDNARYYFQQALTSDPNNQAAQQGLITIASKLVLQARDAIDDGRLDNAEALLSNARSLDASSSDLSAATTALADAREEIAESARQAEAARLAEIERQQEAARVAEAERVAELQRQQEAARQAEIERQAALERQAEAQRLADIRAEEQHKQDELERVANLQREATAAEEARIAAEKLANEEATASPLGVGAATPVSRPEPTRTAPVVEQTPQPVAVSTSGATTFRLPEANASASQPVQQQPVVQQPVATQPAPVEQAPVQQRPPVTTTVATSSGPTEPEMVPVSRLTRTNYVGPEYPRAARRRNLTGSVEVQFTVTTDGRVRAMSILRSNPGDTFDQAAMDAVEQWRFEPTIENGVAVEKRTAVRLAFNLQ